MGNIIEPFASGFGKVVGKLFSSPIDFLSGKSCSSVCGPTWDLMCYIENFCIANILRLALVFVLLYIVLLFFYLSYKLGICTCIGWTICRSIWSCFSYWFHLWEYSCTFLCIKLHIIKRRRRFLRRQRLLYSTSEQDYCDESLSYYNNVRPRDDVMSRSFSYRRRDYKTSHIRKSLGPRNHHARLRISGDLSYKYKKRNHIIGDDISSHSRNDVRHENHSNTIHGVKVLRTTKFVNKGGRKPKRKVSQRHKKF